jgi:transcriptional regulator with XRE-family HTH domain
MSGFTERLKAFRKLNHWSLSEAARQTKIARSYFYQLERGESEPSMSKLMLLANAYSTSLDYLVYGDQDDETAAMLATYRALPAPAKKEAKSFMQYLKQKEGEQL